MEEGMGNSLGLQGCYDMRLCREKITRVKAHVEPNLGAVVKDNKKCSHKYISKKTKTKENLQPLLEVGEHSNNR